MNKKIYIVPAIELIVLDNEISLALESVSPPIGPGEAKQNPTQLFNSDPFKTSQG